MEGSVSARVTMARGRKPDSAAHQAAKGSPGKRRTRKRTPEQKASDLAAARRAGGEFDPPLFLRDEGLADAVAIWSELAPELSRNNLLGKLDRYTFARWCVYQAEWITATRSLSKDGIWLKARNVNGDEMPRRNPAGMHRDRCEANMRAIETDYGLTPANRYRVLRDQSLARDQNPDMFTTPKDAAAQAPAPIDADEAESGADPIGFMGRHAAPPPGSRPN
ncbi:conserved hypothetical protein [Hyphomicrobiales bacterium]|nr:conserved hypothetical protein [Hyphomicrobiales bacterium]CAH1677086.1 conserved hypothetical protein [Hyphomicrobiales bacterium]